MTQIDPIRNTTDEKLKIFYGFSLPPAFATPFSTLIESTKKHFVDHPMRWVSPDNHHITLLYCAWVPPETVESMKIAMDGLDVPTLVFASLQLSWMGAHSPRALTLEFELEKDSSYLFQKAFASMVEEIGFCMDWKQYRPHITFGRHKGKVQGQLHHDLVSKAQGVDIDVPNLTVSTLVLFQSVMHQGRVRYHPIHTKHAD